MDWTLKLRAWHLFCVALIPSVLVALLGTCVLVAAYGTNSRYDAAASPNEFLIAFLYTVAALLFGISAVQIIWQYKIGTVVAGKLQKSKKQRFLLFRASVFLPPLLLLSVWVAVASSARNQVSFLTEYTVIGISGEYLIMLSVLIWGICEVIRHAHLVSTLNQIKHPRIPYHNRSAIHLLLLIFWPVGIWILQPQIRAFYVGNERDSITDHMVD
ncbi:hypothetical protein FUA23_09085 [Neolewinella aurantiaca]|uniref:Uncharacterized protein n=1 Tax=Neolewinella aurantiaca TaxID=2602767 RepID=A0A5C7FW48_9BACT|nr:hypothetical protein [Neolewinella aurantiaca]TXF89829.1 hypothetical protein FUA23_09085 [Neolewinella aurantiaca]